DYWKLLGALYTQSEGTYKNRGLWLTLFGREEYGFGHEMLALRHDHLMTASERKTLSKLPDRFTVYRGYTHGRRTGIAWTIDRAKAEWFANRFACLDTKPGVVITGECRKKDVIAYFDRRAESEIVIAFRDVRKKVYEEMPRREGTRAA